MAEVLGLVASVFSVVSLAIQLGENLRQACDFWDSIEDGPDDIRRISLELRMLANIVLQIRHAHSLDPGQEQMLKDALMMVQSDINGLAIIITELSGKISPGRTSLKRK